MLIEHPNYDIELIDDQMYSILSKDNSKYYQYEYFGGQVIKNRVYPLNKRGIWVRSKIDQSELSSAILCENGGRSKIEEGVCQWTEDKIWVCVGDKIYCLDLPQLTIAWYSRVDYGTNYSIHAFQEDFIVYGELGVIRLDQEGNIKWRFMSGGVFMAGKENIKIQGTQIIISNANSEQFILDEFGTEQ